MLETPVSLEGKVAIVTGANQGLGLQIARQYVAAGASVLLCARNATLLSAAHDELTKSRRTGQHVEKVAADVTDAENVQRVVDAALKLTGRIDILVNSAGIYGPMGRIEDVDWAEWVRTIEVNVYGSVLMCRGVLPTMKRQKSGKIIQLSGGGATNPMPNISAYAVSKAAIVRFAETLAEELIEFNIDVNAVAPGALNTRMLDEVLQAGPGKVGKDFYDRSVKQKQTGGAGLDAGANLALFLASDVSNGITGKLISAVWDDWAHWPEHRDELCKSDAYTLRRIAGRDRGMSWGDK
jgi:NAD(P)-dependent dehydrogenase (short-subunit alcohol dehydrogenase family)